MLFRSELLHSNLSYSAAPIWGETCPTPPHAVGGVALRWIVPLLFTDVNAPQPALKSGLRPDESVRVLACVINLIPSED